MTTNTPLVLEYLGFKAIEDFDATLQDGIILVRWLSAQPQPTQDEIEAAYPAAQAAAARAAIPSITRAQAKAALIISGLIAQVQPAIDAIPDPLQRALAQNDWDERLHFERSNPTLAAMAAALGMTDVQLDDLFALAASL